jgi:hypothetical protein
MRIGGAAGATALAILLFLLDKEVENVAWWVFYPGMAACAVVIGLALLGDRVSLRSPVVLKRPNRAEHRVSGGLASTRPDPYEKANALQREWQGQKRVAVARISEELEKADQVLGNPELDYFLAEHTLTHPAWDEHAERLIEADLMALHKTVRAAYRAVDALESHGVQRGMVTSKGRKIAKVDRQMREQAQVAVREAIEALDEAQVPPPKWQ